ncbi:sorting nexin-25 [Cotesia glomerata]|uniref:Sorting nexin-25 n=1 Tax=Cotesia glomerata TaxID=32391 RepID=A0AAV7IM36_COTGL|nr:sorting nexin-25 [Cotesia glomerata]KAH0554738.1 hypothetical protein KQX54_012514 [Cotesia glomerata]
MNFYNKKVVITSGVVSIAVVLACRNLFSLFVYLLLTLSCSVIGPLVIILIHIALSPKHQTGMNTFKTTVELDAFRTMLMKGYEPKAAIRQTKYPVIFTRSVDSSLQNLLDLIFRDFVKSWMTDISVFPDELILTMKQDLWLGLQTLNTRLSRIDHTRLIASSLVSKVTFHFEKIRIAQSAVCEGSDPIFILSSHLMSPNLELEYLRAISTLFITHFLPRSYSLSPSKFLIREILTQKILKPAINLITDPDYINLKILAYIEQQQLAEAMHRKTYEYAESFEDFIRMIKGSRDLEVLKHIRYNIVTEIMQATTIENVKRAQGLDLDANAKDVQGRKLKRYISQLTFAKTTCEHHMQSLGWDGYPMQDLEEEQIPLAAILDSIVGRRFLTAFLESVSSQGLLGYWAAVQELRAADKSAWHQLGAEIFYTYIRSPTAEIKVDKAVRKDMEAFLMGDKGPQVFYQVQEDVVKIIEDKYYSSFLVSPQYKQMQEALISERPDLSDERVSEVASETLVGEHSTYARSKLDQLAEKLNNKMQALQALKSSLKPESRVLSILAKEVEFLQGEKRQLEAHLSHTEMWAEHLGKWRCDVQSGEIPDNGEPPQFILVVHMAQEENDEGISTGWVVFRKLPEFHELHRKLRLVCSSVKTYELPSQPLKFFGKTDRNALEKAKNQIQRYVNFILEDDKLNQSEALYSFLSPSSEHLKHVAPSPKKSRFSLATLFKGSNSGESQKDEDDDFSLLLEEDRPGQADFSGKDAIAEPLYALVGEIFDLRGVFRWLRKSLITFVQITYGRTINRQVRDTVAWVFSEPMITYYLQLFTKSWWPNGQLAPSTPPRTDEEKLKTRGEARRQFLNNIPEVLASLVGAQSAQKGATKVFDTLQNVNLNKQLFYDILEVVLYEIFPELHRK